MRSFKPKSDEEYERIQRERDVRVAKEFPLNPWHEDIFEEFKPYLKSPIIDIGTKNGLLLDKLEEKGYVAYGVEITDIAEFAQRKGRKVIRCDIQKRTPFEDNFFKSAIMTHTLEHLYKPKEALEEIARIVDGHILITVPQQVLDEAQLRYGHYSFFTSMDDLTNFLTENGYQVEKAYQKSASRMTAIAKCHYQDHTR